MLHQTKEYRFFKMGGSKSFNVLNNPILSHTTGTKNLLLMKSIHLYILQNVKPAPPPPPLPTPIVNLDEFQDLRDNICS